MYIHIPFCHAKCAYCDFFSTPQQTHMDKYIDTLEREYHSRQSEIQKPFRTIYLGGGTPSILSSGQLRRIFGFIPAQGIDEFTIEVNPEDVTEEFATFIAASPVTRVSMGIQSMVDTELRAIGRRHSAADAANAVTRLISAGIDNISLDLIYGLPGQTLESWLYTLSATLDLRPAHLSAYSLMYEPGTRLYAMKEAGKISEAPQELSDAMYRELCRAAHKHGFTHYEISNFAQPGKHSRHNSSYWNLTPYLGLGTGAHSFDGAVRSFNPNSIKEYISSGGNITRREHLTRTEQVNEYLLIRLRTREGLSLSEFEDMFGSTQKQRLLTDAAPHLSSCRMAIDGDRLYIPESMWLLTDSVLVDLISADD